MFTSASRTICRASTLAVVAFALSSPAHAGDRTIQGTFTKDGQKCEIVSTMVIGTDGKPHSTTKTECQPIKK